MTNILFVFGRHEARQHWLRNCITSGVIDHRAGIVQVTDDARITTVVVDPSRLDKLKGMRVSAVFEDDSFVPFDGWYNTAALLVRG